MSNGTVYRRETPSGASSWVAHVAWYEAGKRRQMKRTFRTKKDAQTSLVELLAAHQTGRFVESSKLTVRSFAESWLDGLANQGRKATTLNGYRRIIDSYVAPRLGEVALQDVKASDLDSLYAELLRGGGANGRRLSLTSVHHVHAALNKMLNDAERKGVVIRNVARLANAPSLTTARSKSPEMTVWTAEQLSQFLRSIVGNRNEALFRLLALTGIRRGEAIGLRWSDVDLQVGHVSIRQAVTVVDGEEVVAAPKTRRSRRTIDIDADTGALLEAHRRAQSEALARVDLAGAFDDRVFTNDIGEPMRPDSVGQAFHRLVDKAGVPVIRLHDLRHTHASHLLAAGINVKVVSERLGHASVSFTLDTDGHVMPGQQAEAAAAAAGLLVIK
jgi:integrase